jgi:3-dehydroquinate dehydratase
VQILAKQEGAALRKAKEMREELGLPEIKEIVTDNELLRDAIEMRVDKLEENMKLIEKVVDLMNERKEKKWWQI